jgi:hypothetical protein
MEYAGRDTAGVRFRAAGGLGEVGYSDAIVIDADGRRLELPVATDGGTIRIEVPAAFTATAAYPLLIDPLLQTFAVDTTVSETQDPRVDYDRASNTWLVVAEEHLSATDVDIVCKRWFAGTNPPAIAETLYAHNTAARTINPDVADLDPVGMFAIAWYNPSENNGCFQHRRRDANGSTMTSIATVSVGLQGTDLCRPLIGGCRSGTVWLLALLRQNSTGQDILYHAISTAGTALLTTFGAFPLSGSHVGDITARAGPGDPWVLVWTECPLRCTSAPIRMQAIDMNGNTPAPQPALQLASGFERQPSIAG